MLPRFQDIVDRFGVFGGDEAGCNPQVSRDGAVKCECADCKAWKDFVAGSLPDPHQEDGSPRAEATSSEVPPPLPADAAGAWERDRRPRYEVYTREHVVQLAAYIRSRAGALGVADCLVLEVGAGDGTLSHHLREALRDLERREAASAATAAQSVRDDRPAAAAAPPPPPPAPRVSVVATDDDSRRLRERSPFPDKVVVLSCEAALRAYEPHVVLSCWMPMGQDWTAAIRQKASVREYILVGECDYGICGHPWLTWGFRGGGYGGGGGSSSDSDCSGSSGEGGGTGGGSAEPRRDERRESGATGAKRTKTDPPYAADGWERVNLTELSRWQVCRTDERWRSSHQSRTVSFRRRLPAPPPESANCDDTRPPPPTTAAGAT